MTADVLHVDRVSLRFGGLTVLDSVSLNVRQGESVAIIGPNGAGKTALLNCISASYRPQSGQIRLDGKPIVGKAPHQVVRLGIARSFQATRIFGELTVLENVLAGRYVFGSTGTLRSLIFYPWCAAEERAQRRAAEEVIEQLNLQEHRYERAGTLPYGLRKRVDLARAVALQPRLLLLDEPMAGLNADERVELSRYLQILNSFRDVPLLLIEHDMSVIHALSRRVYALNFGTVIAEGTPAEVSRHPDVVTAYLGRQKAGTHAS